jgi:hypothetical protein
MNPFRKLWQQAPARTQSLVDGLLDTAFVVAGQEYNDECEVHGFYRRVSSDGQTQMGFGFHCPIRGCSDPTKPLASGAHITHCGRNDVLDTEAVLPIVRMRPRLGCSQLSDGTRVVSADEGEWGGEVKYDQSKPDWI